MLRSINTCQNMVSADQYHMTISWAQVESSLRSHVFLSGPLTMCWFLIGSLARVRLTCSNQDWVIQKPVNGNLGLKVTRDRKGFFFYTNVFHCFCFEQFEILQTQN